MALYLENKRVGVYDPRQNIYRRVDNSGRLSGPLPPPWASASRTPTVSGSSPAGEKPATELAEMSQEDSQSQNPPWFPYAVGSGVTGLMLLIGMVMRK